MTPLPSDSLLQRTHGLLVTFRRPDALAAHLRELETQTAPLHTLLVVDNDHDEDVRAIVDQHPRAAGTVRYLGIEDNPGPAGAIAAGISVMLDDCRDNEWLVLLDDDDPPQNDQTLEAIGKVARDLTEDDHTVGGVGLWGARLEQTGRLRATTGTSPEKVAYLPGGACPHYRVGALRAAGGPNPTLFFGFDDLDLGLALERVDASLWSSGIAREHGWSSMVENRRTNASVTPPTWRRYYSLRNLVLILRRNGRSTAAIKMSLIAGIAKPIANLPIQPRTAWKNLRLNLRALLHGWTGQTGKYLDPLDLPGWLR